MSRSRPVEDREGYRAGSPMDFSDVELPSDYESKSSKAYYSGNSRGSSISIDGSKSSSVFQELGKNEMYDISPSAREFDLQLDNQIETIKEETNNMVSPDCSLNINKINMAELDFYLKTEPYNPAILKILFCSIQRAFLISEMTLEGDREMINYNLTKFEFIGDGSYGGVYRMDFRANDHIFTLKISKINRRSNIHEFFIGLQLNKLNCPNFMYVYGIFTCLGNVSEKIGKMYKTFSKLCLQNDGQGRESFFLLQEYIGGDFLMFDSEHWLIHGVLSIYFQLLLALDIAYQNYEYTHHDLHFGNILVQQLENVVSIPYHDPPMYVKARYVVKIIDYGRSFMNYKGKSYGNLKDFKGRIYSSPLADVYRITCEIGYDLAIAGNKDVYLDFLPFMLRFPSIREELDGITDTVATVLKLKDKSDNHWPVDARDAVMNTADLYQDMIQFSIDNVPATYEIFSQTVFEGTKVYGCNHGGRCTSIEMLRNTIGKGMVSKRQRKNQ